MTLVLLIDLREYSPLIKYKAGFPRLIPQISTGWHVGVGGLYLRLGWVILWLHIQIQPPMLPGSAKVCGAGA